MVRHQKSHSQTDDRTFKIFRIFHPWHISRIPHISNVRCDRNSLHLPPDYLANSLADRIRLDDADCDRTVSRRFE